MQYVKGVIEFPAIKKCPYYILSPVARFCLGSCFLFVCFCRTFVVPAVFPLIQLAFLGDTGSQGLVHSSRLPPTFSCLRFLSGIWVQHSPVPLRLFLSDCACSRSYAFFCRRNTPMCLYPGSNPVQPPGRSVSVCMTNIDNPWLRPYICWPKKSFSLLT